MIRKFRIRRAYKALDAAQRAYDAAKERGDTRSMHAALATLRQARHRALWLEVQ